MSYSIKEIYRTIQGEGRNTGRTAVFLRFAGCNLWSGLEKDRARAICSFCDTDFVGVKGLNGATYGSAEEIAQTALSVWSSSQTNGTRPFIVCTGGEPLLQLEQSCVDALRMAMFEVAIETNGTLPLPSGIDWVCVSPKGETDVVLREGNELKLVFPQEGAEPEEYEDLNFAHFYLQPMDGPNLKENTDKAIEYCLAHPKWNLSIQTQKYVGIRRRETDERDLQFHLHSVLPGSGGLEILSERR